MTGLIKYRNSHGQMMMFPTHMDLMSTRNPKVVLPEVLEILERIRNKYRSNIQNKITLHVSLESVSMELNVVPETILQVFTNLMEKGLIEESKISKASIPVRPNILKSRTLYKIMRPVIEEDYHFEKRERRECSSHTEKCNDFFRFT